MTRVNHVNRIIQSFLNTGGHEGMFTIPDGQGGLNDIEYIRRKAGIWQGIDAYKDMDMLILRDVNINMQIPSDVIALQNQTQADQPWSEAHFQERIGGEPLNPGESYKIWPYATFKENDGFLKRGQQFDHSYMERFWPNFAGKEFQKRQEGMGDRHYDGHSGVRFDYGNYNDVVHQLIENPLTRQAFLPIFFPEDTGAKGNIRVPCTLGYLFEIFDDRIDVTYYIRSCDVYRHLRNDVYLAGRLLQHTQNILFINGMKDIRVGKLNMKIANLHLFTNDFYMLKKRENKQ